MEHLVTGVSGERNDECQEERLHGREYGPEARTYDVISGMLARELLLPDMVNGSVPMYDVGKGASVYTTDEEGEVKLVTLKGKDVRIVLKMGEWEAVIDKRVEEAVKRAVRRNKLRWRASRADRLRDSQLWMEKREIDCARLLTSKDCAWIPKNMEIAVPYQEHVGTYAFRNVTGGFFLIADHVTGFVRP